MQFIIPVVQGIGSAVSAVGSYVTGAGSGLVSLGATALSAFSQFSAGQAQQREAQEQAAQEKLGATQEILRGKQSENEILDRVVDTLAQQRVAFAAAGINPFTGSASAVGADTVMRGEQADNTTQDNTAQAWFTRRQASLALLSRGKAAGVGGFLEGLGTFVKGGIRSEQRGGGY